MRALFIALILVVLAGCNKDELSYLSICNETPIPIYATSYTSDYSDGEWISPGSSDEFYTLNIDHLDGFRYFSLFYDSLVVFLKDHEEHPVKFYSDGVTINYDPELNPFTNPEVWQTRTFYRHVQGSSFESMEEKQIFEDYFSIETSSIISLSNQQ